MNLTIEQEILNATSDDWESLEQIYRSVCLEFSSENYVSGDPTLFYLRDNSRGISLAQIADTTIQLVGAGMLNSRCEDGSFLQTISGDQAWKCWYKVSSKGHKALLDSIGKTE